MLNVIKEAMKALATGKRYSGKVGYKKARAEMGKGHVVKLLVKIDQKALINKSLSSDQDELIYVTNNDNKGFKTGMSSNSIFATSLAILKKAERGERFPIIQYCERIENLPIEWVIIYE